MDAMVGSEIPDLTDVPLGDLAKNEDLIAALRHALGRELPRRVVDVVPAPGSGFSSSI